MDKSPQSQPSNAFDDLVHRTEAFARRAPARAVVSAFSIGFLLNRLPLGALTAALVHLAFTLLRPALLVLGAVKACEFCRTHNATNHE